MNVLRQRPLGAMPRNGTAYHRWLRRLILPIHWAIWSTSVRGLENIPRSGPFLIVVNHMSALDTPLVFLSLPSINWRFLVGERWEHHWLYGRFLKGAGGIFVEREQADLGSLRSALKALESGGVLALAPEGRRSRNGALNRGKSGAAFIAARARVPILPIALIDTDTVGHNLRRCRRSRVEVVVGEPFELPDGDSRQRASARELLAYTHLIMVHLAVLLPQRHLGAYAESPALAALLAGQNPWPACLCESERETRPESSRASIRDSRTV